MPNTSLPWKKVKTGEFLKLEYGKNLPTHKRKKGNIPVYGSNGIVGHNDIALINSKGLVVGRKGSIGKIEFSDSPFWPIDTTYYVIDHEGVDLRWTYYLLQTLGLEKMNRGTGIPGLNREDVYEIVATLPPKIIQKKISKILSTVDEEIEKNDQITQKTEILKKGIMKVLLPENLNGTREKGVELTEQWELVRLGDVANITKLAGYEFTKYFNSYRDKGEITVLRGKNIKKGSLDLNDTKTIPLNVSHALPRSQLIKGDLIFSYVGTIGPVALIEENNKFHLGPNVCKISCLNKVLPEYLFTYFMSPLIDYEIKKNISTTAQSSLSMEKIRTFEIRIPKSLGTQKKIVTSIHYLSEKIKTEIDAKNYLNQLKKKLMSDIFSQKIQIN
ncbi:MAG: restriction endonuclease subunit S [Candidatus Woesebacteria bacterium]